MNNYYAITLTTLMLLAMGGCSTLGSSASSAVPDSAPIVATVKAPANTVTPISNTATLIRLMDEAGCDFQMIQLGENLARKGSGTLYIACK